MWRILFICLYLSIISGFYKFLLFILLLNYYFILTQLIKVRHLKYEIIYLAFILSNSNLFILFEIFNWISFNIYLHITVCIWSYSLQITSLFVNSENICIFKPKAYEQVWCSHKCVIRVRNTICLVIRQSPLRIITKSQHK